MTALSFSNFFHFDFPLDLASTIAGGLVGLFLVYLVDWLWRPKVTELGFRKEKVNFGTLYKVGFRLKGRKEPGLCSLEIEWCGNRVFAKWDETPNPLKDDEIDKFVPERVPQTFYQPIFSKREYYVPILIEPDNTGNKEVFSGWWFGKKKGYGPDPAIKDNAKVSLTLTGSNLCWKKEFNVSEIANRGDTGTDE